jgi:hypothetical protein
MSNIKNIIIVTSVIDLPNSIYSRNERFKQTQNTLSTLTKIPDSFIILIDISIFSEDELLYFNSICDLLINDSKDEEFIKKILYEKSFGESCYLLKCIEKIKSIRLDFPNLKSIFKVSGRYYLDDNFNYLDYDNDKNVVKIVDEKLWKNACTTCLFKLSVDELDNFYNSLLLYQPEIYNSKMCMENFFFIYYIKQTEPSKYIDLPILGMSGFVANGIFGSC